MRQLPFRFLVVVTPLLLWSSNSFASASISASPNPCIMGANGLCGTTITLNAGPPTGKYTGVYVQQNNAGPWTLFTCHQSPGTFYAAAPWIQIGQSYVFRAFELNPVLGACTNSPSGTEVASLTNVKAVAPQMVLQYMSGNVVNGNAAPPGPNTPYEVAVQNLNGTNFLQITNDGKQKFLPHYSPDGTKIVYTKFTAGGYGSGPNTNPPTPVSSYEIAVFNLVTWTETILTSGGTNGYGTWSPDGSKIAFLKNARLGRDLHAAIDPTSIVIMNADGSNPYVLATATAAHQDYIWGDLLWSPSVNSSYLLFTVAETVSPGDSTFCKSHVNIINPSNGVQTRVSSGGAACTPMGWEALGDADPGWSPDGMWIYSSRGLNSLTPIPNTPTRHLYKFDRNLWTASNGKIEYDFSTGTNCIDGVPRVSPNGLNVLLFHGCFGSAPLPLGIYTTNSTNGVGRSPLAPSVPQFGPDWNPVFPY